MKHQIVAALLIAALTGGCSSQSVNRDESFRTVTYRGEVVQLSRTYADFREYKDDPKNLLPREIPRVARLVRSALIPESFASRKEADDAFFELMFPGYGLSMLQLHEPVALYSIEIPQMEEDRYVALIEQNGRWTVVDDFLWPVSAGDLRQAKLTGGRLLYLDRTGKVLREK